LISDFRERRKLAFAKPLEPNALTVISVTEIRKDRGMGSLEISIQLVCVERSASGQKTLVGPSRVIDLRLKSSLEFLHGESIANSLPVRIASAEAAARFLGLMCSKRFGTQSDGDSKP
jgi:hypothetical protein